MISVVIYGRNDNYGFHLNKRTAGGLNCLAEILTKEDEILFVDYNTPDHLPTLPEFIWDTLTPKALELIRVIRISSDIHRQVKGDSPLPILENISRNAAITRSNPENHWILSTNPDVIFVLASKWANLNELLKNRPDSFYEMPRFDIPESVWLSLNRSEPKANAQKLRDWLTTHGAAVAETCPDYRFQKFLLFDAPGDFQLAPRSYYFRLRGFDESMNKYLHSDSNLAKRMWLLNGEQTDHLLEDLWVLHQDHYLSGEWAKNVTEISHNNLHRKVVNQKQIEANDGTWGLQRMSIPTFPLAEKIKNRRSQHFQIQSTSNGNLLLSREIDWQLQPLYRLCNYEPQVLILYLREILQIVPIDSQVAYLGDNPEVVEHICRVWQEVAPNGKPIQNLSELALASGNHTIDVLLVDCFYERPENLEKQIALFDEKLQRQVAKGRISEEGAGEELSRFADNIDSELLQAPLDSRWEKYLPFVRPRPGAYVILMGCSLYIRVYSRFQELFAEHSSGGKIRATWLQKLQAYYQTIKAKMHPAKTPNPALKAIWGIRHLKRRAFKKVIGYESIMGWIYFFHITRRMKYFTTHSNFRTLYVHHNMVVMQVKS